MLYHVLYLEFTNSDFCIAPESSTVHALAVDLASRRLPSPRGLGTQTEHTYETTYAIVQTPSVHASCLPSLTE